MSDNLLPLASWSCFGLPGMLVSNSRFSVENASGTAISLMLSE
jgi:hypothetical protein